MGKANKVTDRCQHIRNSYGFWLLLNILWRKRFGRIAVERESAQKFPLFLRIFLNNGFGRVVDSIYIIRSLSFLFSLKKSHRFHSFEISFFWSFSTVAHSICMHSGIHLTILKDKEKTTTRHDKKEYTRMSWENLNRNGIADEHTKWVHMLQKRFFTFWAWAHTSILPYTQARKHNIKSSSG